MSERGIDNTSPHADFIRNRFSVIPPLLLTPLPSPISTSLTQAHPRILHPSPFLLSFPTPPNPSLTTNHKLVHATISLISSAVKTKLGPILLPAPEGPFPLPKPNADPKDVVEFAVPGDGTGEWGNGGAGETSGRATPAGVTTRFRIRAFSTSISGRGKGILRRETTLGWCGVGTQAPTFTRTSCEENEDGRDGCCCNPDNREEGGC